MIVLILHRLWRMKEQPAQEQSGKKYKSKTDVYVWKYCFHIIYFLTPNPEWGLEREPLAPKGEQEIFVLFYLTLNQKLGL